MVPKSRFLIEILDGCAVRDVNKEYGCVEPNKHTMKMSVKEKKNEKELGWVSKRIRSVLMTVAPDSSASKNDLFNSGYGEFAALACQICFFVTFIYYSVVNTENNLQRRFLAPVGESYGICEQVPLEITSQYMLDLNGSWDSQKGFDFSKSAYKLNMNNVKFTSGDASYKQQVQEFELDFKNKSSRGADRDFAWNLMFASSYSKTSYENNGVSSLRVSSDARVSFDHPVWGGGFANMYESCNPQSSSVSYDSTKGALVMEVTDIDPTTTFSYCDWMYSGVNDLGYDGLSSYSLDIDIASVTTAIAVNQGLITAYSLSSVNSGTDSRFRHLIDDFYAPMDPIMCIKPGEWLDDGATWPYEYDDLCFVRAGNMTMLPIISNHGTDTSKCYLPQQCTCDSVRESPGTGCNSMNLQVSFVFFSTQYQDQEDNLHYFVNLMIKAYGLNSINPDLALADLIYPAITATSQANYETTLGYGYPYYTYDLVANGYDVETCPVSVGVALEDSFMDLCDGLCVMLTFGMNSGYYDNYGTKLNSGGYLLNNLSCSDAFYHADTFSTMAATPPTETMQKYQVCRDSKLTCVATGISNAFASAGLYTAILMAVVLSLIIHSHNWLYPRDKLKNKDANLVHNTNTLAVIVEKMVDIGDFTDSEKFKMKNKLASVVAVDAAHFHQCRHQPIAQLTEEHASTKRVKKKRLTVKAIKKTFSFIEAKPPPQEDEEDEDDEIDRI